VAFVALLGGVTAMSRQARQTGVGTTGTEPMNSSPWCEYL